jgi:hypothetical protein
MHKATLALLLFSTGLSGCAELNSIHRAERLPASQKEGAIITVDAKQRHLLLMPEFDADVPTKWRVCAEAAPDVYSAYAASGGAKGDKSGGEVSFASAETAASIERTQTINLLRESFYRTCERYASGAINRTQFIIQAARDQRSMVAVLAIEQLTGAVRPKATIISGPGTSANTVSGADAAALINDYNKRLKTAEAEQVAAQGAVDSAEKSGGVCADGDKKDEAACTALKSRLDSAKKDVTAAQAGLDNAVKLAKDLVTSTTSSTTAGTNAQGGEIGQAAISRDNLTAVAKAVVDINAASFIDEPLMFCIGYLSDRKQPDTTNLSDPIVGTCLHMIVAKQDADQISRNGQPLNYNNTVIGGAFAIAAIDAQVPLVRQISGDWACGDPESERAKFAAIIEDANRNLPDLTWAGFIGGAKTKHDAILRLKDSRTDVIAQFIKSQKRICKGN